MRADRSRFDLTDESGSMIVALLAVIVATGLMVSITAYAFAGQRGVRFDSNRTRSLHSADAGVNEVLFRYTTTSPPVQATWSAWETLGGSSFRWRVDSSPTTGAGDLRVTSQSVSRRNVPSAQTFACPGKTGETVCRQVQAIIARDRPFQWGVFADNRITLNGNNRVDSYQPALRGSIGSNGVVRLNGSATTADAVDLHNYPAGTSLADRCIENGNTVCSSKTVQPPQESPIDLTSPTALSFIGAGLAGCTVQPVWTGATLSGGTHCFERIEIPDGAAVSVPNNVTIYLTGSSTAGVPTVSIGNKTQVGCVASGAPARCTEPEASKLMIFTASYGDVRIGSHAHFAGAIFAPRASCRGNPSNAQSHVYGSLVCGIVTNQGGWSFHYDARLGERAVGNFRIRRWAEG